MEQRRDPFYDNLRLVLIFLVVLGHMFQINFEDTFYRLIYSFHMPCFLFLNGLFDRADLKRTVRVVFVPYVIFQTLIQLWAALIWKTDLSSFSLLTPFWLMWYLPVLGYYQLLLYPVDRLLQMGRGRKALTAAFVLGLCVLLYLVSGYLPFGPLLGLARAFTYLPWFMAGYLVRKFPASWDKLRQSLRKPLPRVILAALTIGAVQFVRKASITRDMLWGETPYAVSGETLAIRVSLLVVALIWLLFLLAVVPTARIPYLTECGRDTYAIFLLHGLVLVLLERFDNLFPWGLRVRNGSISLAITLAVILICGHPVVAKGFRKCITLQK